MRPHDFALIRCKDFLSPLILLALGCLLSSVGMHAAPLTVELFGSGVRTRTLVWENGDRDEITMNLSVNLSLAPDATVSERDLCISKTAHLTGFIRAWGHAKATTQTGQFIDDLNFDSTVKYDKRGWPVEMRIDRRTGRATYIDSQLTPSVNPFQVTPWAVSYSADTGIVQVWVSLPEPFYLAPEYVDQERYAVAGGARESGSEASFYGQVRDCNSSKPIQGASVVLKSAIGSLSTTTDSAGDFKFPSVAPGTMTVTINKPGYDSWTATKAMPAVCFDGEIIDLGGSVKLEALEVVQSIQDLNNRIRLIEEKDTWVRAHFQLTTPSASPVTIGPFQLSVKRGGLSLGAPLPGDTSSLTVRWSDATAYRHISGTTVNFRLPREWTKGTTELALKAEGLTCSSVTSTVVGFEPSVVPRVRILGVRWWDSRGVEHPPPSRSKRREILDLIRAMLPVSSVEAKEQEFIFDGARPNLQLPNPDAHALIFLNALNAALARAHTKTHNNDSRSPEVWYGVFEDPNNFGGLAIGIDQTLRGTTPYVSCGPFTPRGTYDWSTPCHELGHVLGLHHAQYCGAKAAAWVPQFPYNTLGPLNRGSRAYVFGWDTSASPPGVLDPTDYFELMTYCPPAQWVSDINYDALLAHLKRRFHSSSVSLATVNAERRLLIVQGLVDLLDNSVELLPLEWLQDAREPDQPEAGEWELVVLGQGDQILNSVRFDPQVAADKPRDGGREVASFILRVLVSAPPAEVRIARGGRILARRRVSAHLPEIRLVHPAEPTLLGGDSTRVAWEGTDLDGDELTFSLDFSGDTGKTWTPLIGSTRSQVHIVDMKGLPGTDRGLFRVIASDGFNSTSTTSGIVTLPNRSLELDILSPQANQRYYYGQQIVLEGNAWLPGNNPTSPIPLSWMSDQSGVLGQGSLLLLNSSDLKEGVHAIKAEARQTSGEFVSREVRIHVSHMAAAFLDVTQTSRGIQLRWPASLDGYLIEAVASLDGRWHVVDATPVSDGSWWTVIVRQELTSQFYRLRKR